MAKTFNRYDKVLSKLPGTLEWSHIQDVSKVREFLTAPDGLPRIFLGSGGSLSAAQLAMQLSVESGIVAAAMTPYQYIFSAWSKLPAKVFLFSAGGRNVDALNSYKTAHQNPMQEFGGMLMCTPSLLENQMTEDGEHNAFVYELQNGDGFLATNSLLAFYSLLLRIYRNDDVTITDWESFETIGQSLKVFIGSTYALPTDDWDEHDAALYAARETDRFYVLYSPDTMPIAMDLESRFSEGSVGCIQISDYRNFAHGRFNWFHQRKGQTAIIALVTPESAKMAGAMLAELPTDIPVMRLTTDKRGSEGTLELLLKGMYLSKYLGLRWGLDIGAPNVAEFGKALHRMDFMVTHDDSSKGDTPSHMVSAISESILALPIANIARVNGHIVRGETLWASRNRKFLDKVRDAGVDVIIDFRTADFTEKFSDVCKSKGIEYQHFPIDKAVQSDEEMLGYLPELFDLLDNRRCYISCQQGLHRTDIALALYFMFHRPELAPNLMGHKKRGQFRCDDIMRRVNSLYNFLQEKGEGESGIKVYNEAEFRRRRKLLLETNRSDVAADQ